VTRDELLELLSRLRRASVGGVRAPHKPLLLLWLFGRFAAVGSAVACTPHVYGPGTSFFDPGFGHVHIARNEGSTPVTVVQTYLNVPPGGSPRIDAPAPGNCPV